MSATERQLNPNLSLFAENRDTIAPVVQEPEAPVRGGLSNYFSMQVGMGFNPLEPEMEMPTLADNINEKLTKEEQLEREAIANSTIQVSENLNNAPQGIKVEPTSDTVFAFSSFLGIAREATGLDSENAPDPETAQPIMRPVLDPRWAPSPPAMKH